MQFCKSSIGVPMRLYRQVDYWWFTQEYHDDKFFNSLFKIVIVFTYFKLVDNLTFVLKLSNLIQEVFKAKKHVWITLYSMLT